MNVPDCKKGQRFHSEWEITNKKEMITRIFLIVPPSFSKCLIARSANPAQISAVRGTFVLSVPSSHDVFVFFCFLLFVI